MAGFAPFGTALSQVGSTGMAGFILQPTTTQIMSWTAPNDGMPHRAAVFGTINVTSTETGGLIQIQYTDPGGNVINNQIAAAGLAVGAIPITTKSVVVAPGTQVLLRQSGGLSAGAAQAWLELWAS